MDPAVVSFHNNENYHSDDIQHGQNGQRETETPVARVNSLRRFHNPLAHIGTRSNAITSKSAGR
jgi:hypothetical protein